MPFKINVGCSRKLGLPSYGSRGASCSVETEVDGLLVGGDMQLFHDQVERIFAACAQAVSEELARTQQIAPADPPATATNGRPRGRGRYATHSQLYAISGISSREGADLKQLIQARFGVAEPSELSIGQASTLIDELRRFARRQRPQERQVPALDLRTA